MSNLNKDIRASNQLEESDMHQNPMLQFSQWFEEAEKLEIQDANAMTLSTATSDGRPSSRVVLLKEISSEGFIFYTNYQSRKGLEIINNPYGCLSFFWKENDRQIRIEGQLEKISNEKSDEYFESRPKGSQIGAWSSPQSQQIENRKILEDRESALNLKFKDQEVPRPAQWGGYILIPEMIEFWQGRENRLHDRFQYSLNDKEWKIVRLAP